MTEQEEYKQVLDGEEAFKEAADTLIEHCEKQLCLFTYDLDHKLFDNLQWIESVSQRLRKHPSHSFRILVHDSYRAEKMGHRLVDLARRLPSYVQIRKIPRDYGENKESFLIADGMHILYRKYYEDYRGFLHIKAIPLAQQKQSYFDEVWERGKEPTSLRQLSL